MKYCIHCGNEISDSAKYCPYCGSPQPTIKTDPDAEAGKDDAKEADNSSETTSSNTVNPEVVPDSEKASFRSARYANIDSDQWTLVLIGWCLSWIGFLVIELAGDKTDPFVDFWRNQMFVFDLFELLCFIPVIGKIWACVMAAFWIVGLVAICHKETKEVPLLGQLHILD